jgi:H+/Cl- antiporter ClcA
MVLRRSLPGIVATTVLCGLGALLGMLVAERLPEASSRMAQRMAAVVPPLAGAFVGFCTGSVAFRIPEGMGLVSRLQRLLRRR